MNSSQLSRSRSEVESFMPRPMTCLPFSLSLETSGEKSLSPETITKVSMWSLESGQVHGVDAQADVGRVLAGLAPPGDLDQLDGRLVQRRGVVPEAAPVGVRLLDDDLALLDQPFEDLLDVEPVLR